jgi:hypothetical protein
MRLYKLGFAATLVASGATMAVACSSDSEDNTSHIDSGVSHGGSGDASMSSGGSGAVFNSPKDGSAIGSGGSKVSDACGEDPVDADINPVNILIVMDKSKSMKEEITSGVTRWEGMKTALQTALTATQADVDFGISVFPYDPNATGDAGTSDACVMPTDSAPLVPITAGATDDASTIITALDAQSPNGGTPTATALTLALDYFTNGAGAALDGGKYVLLATDGGPNCNASHDPCTIDTCTSNIDGQTCPSADGSCCAGGVVDICLDDVAATAAVQDLSDAGIGTFVVGMQVDPKYAAALDSMAEAGGFANATSPKYVSIADTSAVDDLATTIQNIAVQLVKSCELQLQRNPKPGGEDLLNVAIDGTVIKQTAKGDADGWYLNQDTDPYTVVIQGSTCTDLETNGAEQVQILFGCPTEIR